MSALLAAAALVAACAQAPSDPPRVSILRAREFELPLVDGWPAGPMPWTLVVDAESWRKLLTSGERFDGDAAAILATTAPHVTLHGTCPAGSSRASVALDFAFREGAEERRVEGAPLDPMHSQARIAPDAAVALRMLRSDPLREHSTFQLACETPLIERMRGAATVKFRFVPLADAGDGRRRAWVAVTRDGGAVDVFPADLPSGTESPEWLTLPRYRLEEVIESAAFKMDKQAFQQLDDASSDFPESSDPVALRAVMLARSHRVGDASEAIARFLGEHPGDLRESAQSLDRLGGWLAPYRPPASPVLASARVGRCEVLGDPALPKDEFAAATRVLQIAASALDRLHLVEHGQTFVVLLDRKQASAAGERAPESPTESMPIGWIDVTRLPLADDATALARVFLRAHAGLKTAAGFDALAAWVATLAGRPPTSPQLVEAAELARRTLDGDGPAALAQFVRSGRSPVGPRTDLPPPGSVRLESLGHACFRFTADDGTRLLIDPYSSRYWLQMRFPWIGSDHVVVTHDHPDHNAIGEVLGAPHVIEFEDSESAHAGPFELRAIVTPHDRRYGELDNLVVRISIAGMSFVHLGDVQAPLEKDVCDALRPADVLLAPIDDLGHILAGPGLAAIVESLAPRVVIPMHYCRKEIQGEIADLGGIDAWLASAPNVKRIDHASFDFAKRDLPNATETWVLTPKAWPEGRLEGIR